MILFLFAALIGAMFYTLKLSEMQKGKVGTYFTEQTMPDEKYLSIFSNKVYLVYGDKMAIECDTKTLVKKGVSIETLINNEKYKELLNYLNTIMPEKMERYFLGKEIEIDGAIVEMPYIETESGKYIGSVVLNEIFDENYYQTKETAASKLIVDIMNGTGDAKYAERIGKFLTKKYGYTINNTENEEKTTYTYITPLEIDEEELKTLIRGMREKYIKRGNEPQMNTMANVVVVMGNDKVNDFKIKVISQNGAGVHFGKLKARGYTGLEKIKRKDMPEEDKIVYTGEDYYTALKIAELLGINVFEQDDTKKNIIEVYITGGE